MTDAQPPLSKRTHRRPLAALLVERGIFATQDEAQRWIMTGQVLVDGRRVDKPGTPVPRDAALRVRGRHRYVSRGGYKLEAALDHFGVPVAGRVALDCGASAGGFTDCLLQRGAALVYAVEVGYGQLAGRLRLDPRVRNMERTNLGAIAPGALDPPPVLVTLDLSYLSLRAAMPYAVSLLAPPGDVLALLKPLFEVEDPAAGRTGRVDDPALVVDALQRVLTAGMAAGLVPLGAAKLALRPRHGTGEFFVHCGRDTGRPPWDYDRAALAQVVAGPGIGPAEVEDS
jgi:23S rRNA (cytidine1920-2'-O)/16S rRNA (cytidine1409-2'-O)-methyltransferase